MGGQGNWRGNWLAIFWRWFKQKLIHPAGFLIYGENANDGMNSL
jgi:hypothetical protein